MLPKKLYTDCDPINQPEGTYRYAEGVVLSYIDNAIINEDGTSIACSGFPDTLATPFFVAMFPDNTYVVFSKGLLANFDRIGYVNKNEVYIDLIVDSGLNFNLSYPILKSTTDYNYLSQRIVAWTDNYNNPRILNIDNLPFTLNGSKNLVNPTEIVRLNVFPVFTTPVISLNSVEENGAIPAGNYSFSIFYENLDGTITNYTKPQLNINIIDDSNATGYNKVDGAAPNTATSKSIKLNLVNIDTNYDYYNLVIITSINNTLSANIVKKVKISGTTSTVTFIGNETKTSVTLNDLLKSLPAFNKAKSLTQLDNRLYLANLESDVEIDYQSYANNIKIFYNTKFVVSDVLSNSSKNNIETGFQHGGVYAFYIRFILINGGGLSRAFHIPGRIAGGIEESISSLATTMGMGSIKNYKVTDTTNSNSNTYTTQLLPDGNGYRKISDFSQGTNMGYWKNEDEVYPVNFPDLAGQNVRHHVFPTIRKCAQVHYSAATDYGSRALDILGIDVTNVVIPPELQSKISGYQICYAQKDYTNSVSFGNDIVFYTSTRRDSPVLPRRGFLGGNFNTIYTQPGTSELGKSWVVGPTDYVRGHSTELLNDKPPISGNNLFIHVEMKMRLVSTGSAFNVVGSGDNGGFCPAAKIDYTTAGTVNTLASDSTYLQPISEFRYLPNGILDGNICSIKNVEAISFKINNGTDVAKKISPALSIYSDVALVGASIGAQVMFPDNSYEETYLITYRAVKSNLFVSYEDQILVTTDKIQLPSVTTSEYIHGGDAYISTNCFITTSGMNQEDIAGIYNDRSDGKSGPYIFRRVLVESKYNLNLRYEEAGDVYSKYYPKTEILDLWNLAGTNTKPLIDNRSPLMNTVKYTQDYNKINNYSQAVVYNPNDVLTNKYPYTIVRSAPANTNITAINSWKTFLINDKFDFNRSRGEIMNIENLDNTLLIHHLYTLYRTIGKESLNLSTVEVTLGSGDILAQTPKDLLLGGVGFLGLQDSFGFIIIKGVYCWVNQQDGRIFSYNAISGLDLISDNGLRNDFYTLLKNNNKQFNIALGYDDKNDRILFTFNHLSNLNLSKTISYSIKEKCWISYHKYLPTYYYQNNINIFYIKGNKLYKLNNTAKKCKYDDDVVNPSIIEIVFNMAANINKLFFNFNWISKMLSSLGVIQTNKTVDTIRATNSYQDTGEITLVPHSSFGDGSNVRAERNTWNFNKIRDQNNDVFKRKRLVDKFVIVRFKFNNTVNLDSTQNSLYLYDFDTKIQKSEL